MRSCQVTLAALRRAGLALLSLVVLPLPAAGRRRLVRPEPVRTDECAPRVPLVRRAAVEDTVAAEPRRAARTGGREQRPRHRRGACRYRSEARALRADRAAAFLSRGD